MKATVTTWTCDRCGATEERSGQPNDWLGVLFGRPPEADPMDRKWKRVHLCSSCDKAFGDFLRAGRSAVVPETEYIAGHPSLPVTLRG